MLETLFRITPKRTLNQNSTMTHILLKKQDRALSQNQTKQVLWVSY